MKRNKVAETIIVLVLAFAILYWKFQSIYWLVAAILVGLIGLFIPFIAGKIHWFWMGLAHAIGYLMSKILLTLIFFVIVFPLAMLSRIGRKNPLQLKPGGDSYFKVRNQLYKKEDLENLW
jgi:Saxitoxin biosynthesis operon protein SxtJ